MKRTTLIRRAVAAVALAGFALAGVGFTHVFQPDPDWSGGLHHPTAVMKIDHRMKPDPGWGGG
ncbi:hypothetical protein [Streptacidiphilus jiangxiensis]|uniref:Uncharacterized protein n=1 Tax=Streptacidiphilus jiangxiensis TaxID=235985 RepID=A0A1H7ZLJ9_STRJI|nr:hypothetical protein [Streptacidiphilus jiangxiensis]SEM59206.1 hypothetical protein SAMN05414137_13619 [Streptacidiphilus jiangxiensis]